MAKGKDELARLREIVAKLPTSKDGEPVWPGRVLYLVTDRPPEKHPEMMTLTCNHVGAGSTRYCWFSTEEKAWKNWEREYGPRPKKRGATCS